MEVADAAILADDSLVVAVLGQVGLNFQFTLMPFSSDGDILGSGPVVQTPIGPAATTAGR
jgi:hypothetical protein